MNFRVAKNMFGDYWVGLTDEAVDGRRVFASFKGAQNEAVLLTDGRDINDEDKYSQIDDIRESLESELEVVPESARRG